LDLVVGLQDTGEVLTVHCRAAIQIFEVVAVLNARELVSHIILLVNPLDLFLKLALRLLIQQLALRTPFGIEGLGAEHLRELLVHIRDYCLVGSLPVNRAGLDESGLLLPVEELKEVCVKLRDKELFAPEDVPGRTGSALPPPLG